MHTHHQRSIGLILCALTMIGGDCSSEPAPATSTDSTAGTAGAAPGEPPGGNGNQQAGSNNPAGGSGGTAGAKGDAGSAGAAVDPVPPKPTTVLSLGGSTLSISMPGDGGIYLTRKSSTDAYSDPKWTLYRASVTDGAPHEILSSPRPLELLTVDSQAYYIHDFQKFDSNGNTWDGDVVRMPLGTTTFQPFASAQNTNEAPRLMVQTPDRMILGHRFDNVLNVVSYGKPGGGEKKIASSVSGSLGNSWIEGDSLFWIAASNDEPGVYSASLKGGSLTKVLALPSKCSTVVHYPEDGYVGFCVNGTKQLDLVRISKEGSIQTLLPGVGGDAWYSYHEALDRFYWADNIVSSSTPTTFHIYSAKTGALTHIKLPYESFPLKVEGGYFYFYNSTSSTTKVSRIEVPPEE